MSADTNFATYSVPIKPNTSIEGVFMTLNQPILSKEPMISIEKCQQIKESIDSCKTEFSDLETLELLGNLDGFTLSKIFTIPEKLVV